MNLPPLLKLFSLTMLAIGTSVSFAGPVVVPNPKNNDSVEIRNNDFEVVRVLTDSASIKTVQGMFARAKKIGDTASNLKRPTHKINFSDSWLVDLKSGEIGVLSKAITTAYQLEPEDLKTLQLMLQKGTPSGVSPASR